MKLPLNQRRLSCRKPELGDWRVPVDNPADVQHLPLPLLPWYRRFHLRVRYQQSQLAAAPGMADFPVIPPWGWRRAARLCAAAFFLLPLSVIMALALLVDVYRQADVVTALDFWLSVPVWYSLVGIGVFLALMISYVAKPILIYVYVLGHELTHAVATIVSFGRVHRLCIDLGGGYVETDKDNLLIALSPYFVPLWMLVWMLVLWGVNFLYPFPEYQPWFYAGFGFWWSFHLYWTMWVIPREQPDMLENGRLLSALVTILGNLVVLLIVLRCFGVVSLRQYWLDIRICACEIGAMFGDIWHWLLVHSV